MNIIKCASVLLSVLGFILGLIAAFYWLKASKVVIDPAWELQIRGDVNKNIMGWVAGYMIAFKKAGDLNARAAKLTAVAVVVSLMGSVLSTLQW